MIYVALFCIALLAYSYAGFPLLLAFLAKRRPRTWTTDETYRPTVSIILPAHNEEAVLSNCLESIFALRYPQEQVEVLCGSDGSTDTTNAIIAEAARRHSNLRPIYFEQRRGKMLTRNDLVASARGEILFFVDADVVVNPNALANHARHFVDETVGAVGGNLEMQGDRESTTFQAELRFWRSDRTLRMNEAAIGSSMALYGGNYTMRRSLWTPLPSARVYDDFFSVLSLHAQRKRIVYEPEAWVTEPYARNVSDEYRRKKRNTAFALSTLSYFPSLVVRPSTAWMLWPHKIVRWFSGFLIAGWLAGSLGSLVQHSILGAIFSALACVAVILVLIGSRTSHQDGVSRRFWWLFWMSLASVAGIVEFLLSRQSPLWQQATRGVEVQAILLPTKSKTA